MSVFSEDFSAYTLGTQPNTWGSTIWDIGPFESFGTVVSADIDNVTQHAFQLGRLQTTTVSGFSASNSLSHKFRFKMGQGPGLNVGIPIMAGQIGTGGYEVFGIGLNGDSTLFVRTCAPPSAHTTTPVGKTPYGLHREVWYDIIANVEFLPYLDLDMIFKVAVQVNVAIDGIELIDEFVNTQTLVSTFGGVGLGISRWVFQPGTTGGSTIADIEVNVGSGSISPPVAVEPATIFQGIMEVVYTADPDAVIYQAVIELVQSLTSPPTAIATCVMHS